jgi:hypothetical protein
MASTMCSRARQVALGWLNPHVPGRYLPVVANDVFNGMEAVASCHLTMSRACVVRHRVVGPPDTIAIHREWAVGQRYTVAIHREWPADRRCHVLVLQTSCPHVLLVFNVLPAACLACARYRPCRVAFWKIHTRPDERS